jgi:beta-galactosidase/beta-glucuronidase
VTIEVPSPKLWSPSSPKLYDLKVTTATDYVLAYFGLRTFELSTGARKQPLLNGKYTFMAGFLDQSWWPDGQYTAPSDEALASDLEATKMFGLNMIRLHQKVNPERWYYHADRLGLVIFQDMVQKYGGANHETVPLFVEDLKAMVLGKKNHPCIVQWTTFNEGDCWNTFKTTPYDVKGITEMAKRLDPTRLVDTDSGGGANSFKLADVNDIHDYPWPGNPQPSETQYAMIGEFGGIGAFVKGKEWVPGACHTYLKTPTPSDEASKYIQMAKLIEKRVDHVSASVYTQTTDVELECDGFLNYDRSNKFSDADTAAIREANLAIIRASQNLSESLPLPVSQDVLYA